MCLCQALGTRLLFLFRKPLLHRGISLGGDRAFLFAPACACLLTFIYVSIEAHAFPLFLLLMAAAFFFASALLDAPQARSDNVSLVGLPLASRSGPGMLPIRAKKDARLGLSPLLTGGFNVPPL